MGFPELLRDAEIREEETVKKRNLRKVALGTLTVILAWGNLSSVAAQEEGKTVVVSERVGKIIDLEERNHFKMFSAAKGFQFAVFLQNPDGSYVAKITYEENGVTKERHRVLTREELLNIQEYLDNFEDIQRGTYSIEKYSKTSKDKVKEKVGKGIEVGKWHLSYARTVGPALATNDYYDLFWRSGYGDDIYHEDSWGGSWVDEYPQKEGSSWKWGMRLSRSVKKPLNLGIGVSKGTTQEIYGNKNTVDSNSTYNIRIDEEHQVNTAYAFATLSYFPKDLSLDKKFAQLGFGVSYNRVESGFRVNGKKYDTSHVSLGVSPFLEIGLFLGRIFTLGLTAEGNFLPSRKVDSFQYEYNGNGEKKTGTFPSHKVNFGSFGIGIHAGLHF